MTIIRASEATTYEVHGSTFHSYVSRCSDCRRTSAPGRSKSRRICREPRIVPVGMKSSGCSSVNCSFRRTESPLASTPATLLSSELGMTFGSTAVLTEERLGYAPLLDWKL